MNWWTGFFRLIQVLYGRRIITAADKAFIECKISKEEYSKMIELENKENEQLNKGDN